MKKLLIVLIALGSVSSFAGKIKSKRTDEVIEVNLTQNELQFSVRGERKVSIYSSDVNRVKSNINLLGGMHSVGNYFDTIDPERNEIVDFAIAPLELAYIVGAGTYDILSFPIKGTIKLINNRKYKKDIRILEQVASSEEEVVVNHKRFKRIEKLLVNL